VDESIAYMKKPSSRMHFPVEGITHDRLQKSLDRFKQIVEKSSSPADFARRIADEFDVYMSVGCDGQGTVLFTGYCEPVIPASLERTGRFCHPLYRLPEDLVKNEEGTTLGRRTSAGALVPYYTRKEIDQSGVLKGKGLELGWVEHPLDAFIIHVQGSATLKLTNGTEMKIGYAGKNGRRMEPLDFNSELEESVSILANTLPRTTEIEMNLAPDLHIVEADPSEISQLVMNLGLNASDAMPDGGRFTVETSCLILDDEYCRTHVGVSPGRYVMLAVSDTGHGMDRETLAHIFEPFFTTKEAGRGTGLGLAMVYGIVKQHRGHITCYSQPGVGTEFKVYFPVIEEPAAFAEKAADERLPGGGGETVLLVDDEESIRELGTKILRHAGYEVLTATNGREGVDAYHRERSRIALVVLDLIMPEMGGRQCLEQLLAIDPRVKVVIASGYTANGPLKDAIESGAKAHVRKPYNMKEFLETVRKVLDEA